MPQNNEEDKSAPITIDPCAPGEHAALLDAFFLREEKEEKSSEKRRSYKTKKSVTDEKEEKQEVDEDYPFLYNNTNYRIHFTQPLIRRKKSYRDILLYNAKNSPPKQEHRKKDTLYIQETKSEEGGVFVYTQQNKNPTHLNHEQWAGIKKRKDELDKLAEDGCNVFLMATPATEKHKPSDKHHLYVYRDEQTTELYYYIKNQPEDQTETRYVLKNAIGIPAFLFNQPEESAKECEERGIYEYILKRSSDIKHTLGHRPTISAETARHKKISAVMSECGYPINGYIYNIRGKKLGRGANGDVFDSPGKLEHSDSDRKMIYIDYDSEHARGCQIVLMPEPNRNTQQNHEISDKEHLYLYQKITGEVYYRINNNGPDVILETRTMSESQKDNLLKENFNETTKFNDETLPKAILEITSQKGHTFGTELTPVSRKPKAFKIQITQGNPNKSEEQRKKEEKNNLEEVKNEVDKLRQTDKDSQAKKVTRHKYAASFLQRRKPGKSLDIILKEKNLTAQQRYDLTIKLLEALDKFHEPDKDGNVFVHRDIKPGNIMVDFTPSGEIIVNIIDVDFAKKENTWAGYYGTPGYIPPEINTISHLLPVTKQHDYYAMGRTLRKIWQDKTLEQRDHVLGREKRLKAFLAAEHYLNISMKPPSSNVLESSSLTEEQKASFNKIMNEMTETNADERLSVKETLSILRGHPSNSSKNMPEIKEEKTEQKATIKPPFIMDEKKATESLERLDPHEQLFLLNEAIENIRQLDNDETVTLTGENRKNLDEYFHLINQARKYNKFPDEKIINVIIVTSKFLSQLKTEKANIQIDENALAPLRDEIKKHLKVGIGTFIKKAWNDTFLPDMDAEERKNKKPTEYLLGWPAGKNRTKEKILYVSFFLLGGFLIPVKNIFIKLSLEFSFKMLSESASFLRYKANQAYPGNAVIRGVTSALYWIPETIRLLVRTVTSPLVSIRRSDKRNILLGIGSGLLSAGALVGFIVLTLPLLPVIGGWLLKTAGLAATISVSPALIGAAAITTPFIGTIIQKGIAEQIQFSQIKPEEQKNNPEKLQEKEKKTSSSTSKATKNLAQGNQAAAKAALNSRFTPQSKIIELSVSKPKEEKSTAEVEDPLLRASPRASSSSNTPR